MTESSSSIGTRLSAVRVTLGLSVLMVAGYVVSGQFATEAGVSGPKPYFEQFLGAGPSVVYFLFPFLHAGESHLVRNLVVFVVFGGLVESRDDWKLYGIFLAFVALVANVLGPMLVRGLLGEPFSGVGLGASGMTFALVARECVFRSSRVRRRDASRGEWVVLGVAVVLSAIGVLLVVEMANAWLSHLLGFLIGGSIGVVELTGGWRLEDERG